MKKLFVGILMGCLMLGMVGVVGASKTVFISGIENGICVVPNVNLWSEPSGVVVSRVNGCSGIPVKVIKTKQVNGRLWYHIKTFGSNVGKSGWVLDTFIKN